MADVVKDLEIRINAEASKANSAIDNLVDKLDRLKGSLGKLNVTNLNGLADGIGKLGTAMQGMSNVKTTDVTRVVKNISKFSTLDGTKLTQVSTAILPLASAIGTLGQVDFNNKGVLNLVNSLTRLSKADVGSLNNVDFTKIGQNINTLTNALNGAQNVASNTVQTVNAVSRLASAGSKAQAASAALPTLGTSIKKLVDGMSSAKTISEPTIQFSSALGTLASAGNKTAQTAANLKSLATELKGFMQVMSTAPTVNSNIIQMTQALGNLAANGNRIGGASRGLSSAFNSWGSSAGKASKKSFSLASAIGKVYATYWMLFRAMGGIRKAIDISGALTEVQNVVSHSFGPSMEKVNEQAKEAIYNLGMSELSFKQYASTYQSMGNAMGITAKQVQNANSFLSGITDGYVKASNDLSDVSLNLTKLAGDIASFYDKDQTAVAEDLQSVYTGMVVPLRKYGLDLTQATLKQWALKNGLDADIDSMTQAQKTMLRYQYVMSQTTTAQGDFARTAGTWNNQVRLLTENFKRLGAVWGNAFINMLKPTLTFFNTAMDSAVNFSETVVNSLGVIFGWRLEIQKATADETELGNADLSGNIDDATASAKKLRQQLQGIDELNVLTTNKNNSGNGNSSGTGTGYDDSKTKFNVVETDGLFKSKLDTLNKLGSYVSDAISDSLESIDWDKVYKKASGFGKGLADYLNGLINPRLFGNLGRTIANSLNTALTSLNSFGEEFDWANFGKSIGEGITSFFKNYDFVLAADTVNTFVNGIASALINGLKATSWTEILKGGIDFLTNLDLSTVVVTIGAFSWRHGGKEIVKDSLSSLLSSKVKTGIGSGEITVSATIKLSLVTAIAGFKIGNELYKNVPTVKQWADSLAKWLFDGKDNINIAKTITVSLGALTLAVSTAKVSSALAGIITGNIIPAATTTLASSSALTSATKGLANAIFSSFTLSLATAFAGFKLGEWLYNNNVFGMGDVADKIAEQLGHNWDDTLSKLPKSVREFFGGYIDEDYVKEKEQKKKNGSIVDVGPFEVDTDKLGNVGKGTALGDMADDVVGTWLDKLGLGKKITSEADKQLAEVEQRAAWKRLGVSIGEQINNGFNSVTLFKNGIETGKGLLEKYFPTFAEKGKEFIKNLSNGASQSKGDFTNASKTVVNSGASVLTNSQTAWKTTGINLAANLSSGLYLRGNDGRNGYGPAATTAAFLKTTQSKLGGNTTWKGAGVNLVSGLTTGLSQKGNDTKNGPMAYTKLFMANTNSVLASNSAAWKTAGTNLVSGLSIGISEKWGNSTSKNGTLFSSVKSLATSLTNTLKSAFGIHSPSRIWRYDIGNYLPLGLQKGVIDKKPQLLKTISQMGLSVTNQMQKSLEIARPQSSFVDTVKTHVVSTMDYQYNNSADSVSGDIAQSVKDGIYSAQSEQNSLLRQQNELLYQILQKDTGISSDDVYNAVVRKNTDFYNRTGYTPLVI